MGPIPLPARQSLARARDSTPFTGVCVVLVKLKDAGARTRARPMGPLVGSAVGFAVGSTVGSAVAARPWSPRLGRDLARGLGRGLARRLGRGSARGSRHGLRRGLHGRFGGRGSAIRLAGAAARLRRLLRPLLSAAVYKLSTSTPSRKNQVVDLRRNPGTERRRFLLVSYIHTSVLHAAGRSSGRRVDARRQTHFSLRRVRTLAVVLLPGPRNFTRRQQQT